MFTFRINLIMINIEYREKIIILAKTITYRQVNIYK